MSHDKLDLIYESLTHFRTESSERMTRIEEDLREHKEGVVQNREGLVDTNKRVSTLEEPRKALHQIKKWALWLTALGGLILIIEKVIKL